MTGATNHRLAAATFMAAAFLWTAAAAQEVPRRQAAPAPSPPATAAKPASPAKMPAVDGTTGEAIVLTLNKARVVALSRPVGKIIVGNEAVADVHFDPSQPTKVYILSKAIGTTNVFFLDRRGETIEHLEVRVAFDENGIKDALKRLMPEEYIDVSAFRDSVFLTGKVRSASAAKNAANIARRFVAADANVTNMLTVIGGQQVILQVRVAEMDRDVRKNLSASGTFSKVNLFGARTRSLNFTTTSPTPDIAAFAAGTLATGTSVFGTPAFQALERQNLAKTLAEPTLTAISGETASFLSGGEFPFPSGLDENGQTIFEFRQFGIGLNFTPTVVDENRISLQIAMEISAIDTSNSLTITSGGNTTNIPGLSMKRTETTIDLPSGGTLMISGLLKDDLANTISGFPFLKDVPVLGALFRSTQFQQQQTELVVVVTTYLAKPVDKGTALSLPTDGFEPASDIDIYLLGRLHRSYTKADRPLWADPLKGPFGYIMK
jgi:pilus assembly protein CpaC